MKFIQVHTFYDTYWQGFYESRPGLGDRSFEEQRKELLSDGFSASHLFGAYLSELGFNSNLLIPNCAPMQVRWAIENGVSSINEKDWMKEILRAQIDKIRPDVLYLGNPIDFDSRFIRTLSYRPKLVFGWRAASFHADNDLTELDLLISSDPYSREKALKLGAKRVQHFLPAYPEWIAEKVKDEPKQYDLSFCGQITNEHKRRAELVELISKESIRTRQFTPRFFLSQVHSADLPTARQFIHPAAWGLEMFRQIKRAKIGFNCVIDFAKQEAGNMRQFETTGTGTFLLTEHHDTLDDQFKVGYEIETFKTEGELIEKILYYSQNDAAREEIAKRGQQRCFNDHGLKVRLREFVAVIEEALKRKETGNIYDPVDPSKYFGNVDKAPKGKRFEVSFSAEQANAIAGLISKTRSTPRGSIVMVLGEDLSPFECALKALSNLSNDRPTMFIVAKESIVDNGKWLEAINERCGAEDLFDGVKIIATQNGKISPAQIQRIGKVDFAILLNDWLEVARSALSDLAPSFTDSSVCMVADFLSNTEANETVRAFERKAHRKFDYNPIDAAAVVFAYSADT